MNRVGLVLGLALALLSAPAFAKTADELARELSDPKKAEAALDELVKLGKDGLRALQGEAAEGKDLAARGWAIAGLAEIGGEHAGKTLLDLQEKGSPEIVRSWAAAARVNAAPDVATLVANAELLQRFPAVDRPFKEKLKALAASDPKATESLLKLSVDWRFQQIIADPIVALGLPALLDALTKGSDVLVRQQAAAYLGVLAQRQGAAAMEIVGMAVVKRLAFDPKATEVPWVGGALFLPGLGWDKPTATKLVRELTAWDVWAQKNGRTEERSKITQNVNQLAHWAGMAANWQVRERDWLAEWARAQGRESALSILEQQGLHRDPEWLARIGR